MPTDPGVKPQVGTAVSLVSRRPMGIWKERYILLGVRYFFF
jgi:hypothetical protein